MAESKFKSEQIVWWMRKGKIYRAMIWIIKPVQDDDILDDWEYSFEVLEGPMKGEFKLQYEVSLHGTIKEAKHSVMMYERAIKVSRELIDEQRRKES